MTLSASDEQAVRTRLAALQHQVTLLFFTQTIGEPPQAVVTRRILDAIAGLSDRIALETINFVLDKDKAIQFGIEDIPAVALLCKGEDTRMRFLGAPTGFEFVSLVDAVVLAGGDDSGLSDESKALIAAHVSTPIDIKVFVTPTCPHCPRAVTLAHRMAVESPHIRATCIEATEFLDLSRKHRVTGVPKTIVNGTIEILGALPEDAFVRQVAGLPATNGDENSR